MKIKYLIRGILICGILGLFVYTGTVFAQTMQTSVQVSSLYSTISPGSQVIRSGNESAFLTVKLLDSNKNPIQGHLVKLISSSGADNIQFLKNTPVSDVNGEVVFQVNSRISGLVSYTAYDLTADLILDQRAKVVYFISGADVFQNQSFVKAAAYGDSAGNSSGLADRFEFEEIPAEIKSNQSVSLKVAVYDAKNQIVNSYTGKVRFSVDGLNSSFATLPEDYTFTIQDQGAHVFSLAFIFKQNDSYNLKVTDLTNVAVFGTKPIVVSGGTVTDPESLGLQSGIVITNPAPGIYSSNVQVITGTAHAGDKLKIFDNNLEISSAIADTTGKFSFTTGLLADGVHKIYAAAVNDIGTIIATSSTVDITIDTQAAEASQIVIEPEGAVDPGTTIKVKVYAEETLSKAHVVVAGNVYNLEKKPEGYYETSFSAPIDFGEYKLNFVLVDDLGNESKSSDKVIKVGSLGLSGKSKPGKVTGVIATPAANRIILNWNAPGSLANAIKNYRVYYGFSPNQLTEAVDTLTNATTWYIPNLKNGTEYFFAVAAVDFKGDISEGFDKIVSAVANSPVKGTLAPEVANGSGGQDALKDMKEDAGKAGPEIIWLIFISMLGGMFYGLFSRKKIG